MASTVAFVLKGYPRLSETFIAQEILALEQSGLDIAIASLRRPTDTERHPINERIKAPVQYLPEFPGREPLRVLKAWWRMRRMHGYPAALGQWLRDLVRAPTIARFRAFPQALALASEIPPGVRRLHAHFLHTPASVARYAAMMLALPWSCSAHARDIWTTPEWEKREKLADADWFVTCSEAGRRHLAALAPAPERVELVYHGLDLGRLPRGYDDVRVLEIMRELYAPFLRTGKPLIAMSIPSAELTKYATNTMLAARISLINEHCCNENSDRRWKLPVHAPRCYPRELTGRLPRC